MWRVFVMMLRIPFDLFLYDRPTGVDWRTGEELDEAIELKGNYVIFFLLRRLHPKSFTCFYLNGINLFC